jgi:hypothetical protein
MQVHHGVDHSLACLDSYTCAINFDLFVRCRSLNLLLKYSSETTRLSAGRPSGVKQCGLRTQSRSLAAKYKNSCAFALHMAKTHEGPGSHLRFNCEGRSQGVWRSKCCDLLCRFCRIQTRPSSKCQFSRKKEMEFVRQVSQLSLALLSEINQQLKQEFRRIAMKRTRHVYVIQTCFGRPQIGFRCFADKS